MDAQAYLVRQGWTGPGNPLNPNRRPGAHGGLGLTKPILAARKQNTHGLGRKTTGEPGNQWWLRGFDDALRGVGNGENTSGFGSGSHTVLESELYRFFVRGEGLRGTINENQGEEKGLGKKRKRDADGELQRKEEKRKRKKEKRERNETSVKESREERRARKQAKSEKRVRKQKKEERKEGSDSGDISREQSSKAKQGEETSGEDDYPTPAMTEPEPEDLAAQDGPFQSKDKRRKEKKQSKKTKKPSRD